jgi:hypothetical protein
MPPLGKERHFEILVAVTAMLDERAGSEEPDVPVAEAAAAVGVGADELRRLLEPLLYLEFRIGGSYLVSSRDFFLDPDTDTLRLDDRGKHWLRDLRATPPEHDSALRLLIAGTVFQADAPPSPALAGALDALAREVAATLVVPVARPPLLAVAQDAYRRMRSLRFRYSKAGHDDPTDREMLPWRVYSRWGHWYCWGPDVGDAEPKAFRVDRMITAAIGAVDVDPPPDLDPPDWFDLGSVERSVTVAAPAVVLDSLPQPCRIEGRTAQADGRDRATVTVAGERQLDHLLVALGPDGDVVDAPELVRRRREWAAHLLDSVCIPPAAG